MSDTSATPLDKAREAKQTVIEQVLLDAGAKSGAEVFADRGSRAAWSGSDYEDSDDDDEDSEESEDELGELEKLLDVLRRAETREDLTPKQRVKIQRAVLTYLTEFEEEEDRY